MGTATTKQEMQFTARGHDETKKAEEPWTTSNSHESFVTQNNEGAHQQSYKPCSSELKPNDDGATISVGSGPSLSYTSRAIRPP